MNKVARKGGECPVRKLVKVYTNITDLENDNLKEIEIDTDKKDLLLILYEARGVLEMMIDTRVWMKEICIL